MVIVDVLSFSTAVDIAIANGAAVIPYRWRDESAAPFAKEKSAQLACERRSQGSYSLSPASLQSIACGTVLVLPSPNGSTLSLSANVPTFAACLRNAEAVASYLGRFGDVAVIPAGERWGDDSLRPCLEDWIGAGAVLSLLRGRRSPEADLAVAVFERCRADLNGALSFCESGRKLIERGFARDIELAAEYGASAAVPMLEADRFVNAARGRDDESIAPASVRA